jgi:hypothetical protein
MANNVLSDDDRQLIWEASELNDGELKVELYKALIGSAADMKTQDRDFFIEKVQSIQDCDLIDRHIELVTEICTTIREPQNYQPVIIKCL